MNISTSLHDAPPTTAYSVCLRDGEFHRAAIALNNSAVCLLIRGFYQDALHTFQAAIKLIIYVADSNEGEAVQSQDTIDELLRLPLQRAWQRAASPRGNQCDILLSASPEGACIVKAVSSEYNPAALNEVVAICAHNRKGTFKFPMTIDPIDFEGIGDSLNDVDFHSSVLLYNCAIACDCLAAAAATRKDSSVQASRQERVRAYHMSQLSSYLLIQQSQNYWEKFASNCYAIERVLQLRVFLTHNLIEASIRLDLPLECHMYCQDMEEMFLLIEAGQLLIPLLEDSAARAA
jgi:hypothetical protein